MLARLLPTVIGLFCVSAALCNWDWFFGYMAGHSPLAPFLPKPVVRTIGRFIVAILGAMVATFGFLALAGKIA